MPTDSLELKVTVEKPRAWARRLTITVPADRVQRQREEVGRRLAQRIRIPGFRKGKVPQHVVERSYGPAIDQEAVERVVKDAFREAVERENLHPITQGEIENIDYRAGEPLTFDVHFEVRPEIELERLGGFEVKRERAEIGDADVERVVDRLRAEHAVWKPVEGESPAERDMVDVEVTPLREGGERGETRRYQLVLGEGQALPEIEEAIRSLQPGGEGEFVVHPPEGATDEHGQPIGEHKVQIRLLAAHRPELPEADDEFARSVGDFEGLEALRSAIRSDLEREADAEADQQLNRQLIDLILEANPFEVPDSMIDRYLEGLLRPREGADPERVAEMRAAARPAAERALKRMLVIDRVAELEGLHATPAEVDARVEEIAQRTGRPAAEVRAQLAKGGRLEAIAEEITETKVFDYLKSLSTIA